MENLSCVLSAKAKQDVTRCLVPSIALQQLNEYWLIKKQFY